MPRMMSLDADATAPGAVVPVDIAEPTLSDRTIRATPWRSGSLFAQGALQFGFGIVLARMLPPGDFGVAALALVVVGFVATLAELGLTAAVIYLRPLSIRHIRASFTLSLLIAATFGGAMFLLAPFFAGLFDHPMLPAIFRAEASLFVLTALGTTARALLHRRLDFRRLFLVEVGGYVGGYAVIAVPLAALGFGVWSLVIGILTQAGLTSGLALVLSPHSLTPLLAARESRELLSYGGVTTLNGAVGYWSRSADSLVVGRMLGTVELGLYNRAFNVITVPLSYLGSALTGVLFPVMAEVRSDQRRLRSAYLLSVQVTAMIAAPLCGWVLVAAPHIIGGLYGPGWEGAIAPLRVLAAGGLFRSVYHVAAALTHASANVMAEVRRQLMFAALVAVGGLVGASWGIAGVAAGVLGAMLFMYLAMAHLSLRIVDGGWRQFLTAQLAGLGLGLFVGIGSAILQYVLERRGTSGPWILGALTAAAPVFFALGIYLLPPALRPIDLFSRIDGSLQRLPTPVRLPLRRLMRVEV
jgi:O-antigen/teichoic acid export membrane protein